ncbi:hypothetical protein C8R45DRAFT_930550 [Mycena sanguinolenta]|nr:hypothetical protein C8R45DRAFT_930550 [Mycena sanguinolenta]
MTFPLMKWPLPRVKSKRLSRISHALPLFRKLSEDPVLPVELWDVVLNLLNNDGLLLAACVCRTWNEISIALYMRRHNVGGARVLLQIPSFLLQPLHLSCVVPQIHTLRCIFPTYAILRRMRSLREVVAKCPHLIHLSVDWGYDPFRTRASSPNSADVLVAILRDVLRTLAARTRGPVFVVGNGAIQRFEADEIRRWPLIPRMQFPAKRGSKGIRASVIAHDVDGDSFSLTDGSSTTSVDVRSIRVASGPLESFTQITFPTTILSLCPTEKVPAEHLSILLSHISLPYLQYLHINKDLVDAAALSEFQRNHPRTELRSIPVQIALHS